jgi:hypothetical protein
MLKVGKSNYLAIAHHFSAQYTELYFRNLGFDWKFDKAQET